MTQTELILQKLNVRRNDYSIHDRLKWQGEVIRKHGNLIIRNKDTKDESKWIFICYHLSGKVFVCLKSNKEVDEMKSVQKKWFGQEYDRKGRLIYQGDFQYFEKHSENGIDIEYQENGDIKEVYLGKYWIGARHDQKATLLNKTQRFEGKWEEGCKQGKFRVTKDGLNKMLNPTNKKSFAEVKYFKNDYQTKQQITPKPLSQPTNIFQQKAEYNIDVSQFLYQSLNNQQWLTSGAVDFFYRHLSKSYNYYAYQHQLKPLCCWTTFMFQKYIPSSKVSDMKYHGKYQPFQSVGLPTKNNISIFQRYPIILTPLNIDQSHFVLGAIVTQTKRIKKYVNNTKCQVLQSISFTLYFFDSFASTQQHVGNRLISYMKHQISTNISQQNQHIYFKALESATKVNYKTKKFALQNNSNDCGVFTCIFGALLVIEIGVGREVKWEDCNNSIKNIRQFIQEDIVKDNKMMFESLMNMLKNDRVIV